MAQDVPFLVTELGSDVDPFVLHLYAALAEKERALISQRTEKQTLAQPKHKAVRLWQSNISLKLQSKAAATYQQDKTDGFCHKHAFDPRKTAWIRARQTPWREN